MMVMMMILSNTTAPQESRVPLEPLSTTLYSCRPSTIFGSIFHQTIQLLKFKSPLSSASFEFKIHYSSGWFIIVIHCMCPASRKLPVLIFPLNFSFEIDISKLDRSRWPHGPRRGSAADRLRRLRVQIPPVVWMFFSCDCFLLSGRGLYDGPLTHPGESYRVCVCPWVWLGA